MFEANEAAPGAARNAVRSAVGNHPRLDALLLATSELVTNVVRHASRATAVELVVEGDDPIRVMVRQPGHDDFDRVVEDPSAPTGRGLFIVAAHVDTWGIDTTAGIEVWFEIAAALPRPPRRTGSRPLESAELSDSMNDSFS